ncbi:MAG: hypothetical protein JSU07_10405 [Bacteroidetes bacterium]|nr:hypothetical protein [Bacteroidota bacterium]
MAQNILAAALSDSTRSSYRSAVNHIAKFHEQQKSNFTFPVSSDTLCLWMASSIDKLTYSSIRNYLHGIATTQMELGYPNPLTQSPLVWRMFKAIKRLQGQQVVRKRLPITVAILSQINSFVDTNNELDLCMRAAMWLGTCGLLRAGEFVRKPTTKYSLKLQHLTFHDSNNNVLDPFDLKGETPFYMSIKLDQSKTDPFRQGTNVIVGNPQAIEYMLAYLRRRNQRLARLPLFVGNDGQALTASALVKFTQSLIEKANIPNAHLFLGHSFRKGGATSLHEAGHPDSLIKTMGRWASFAFATYVHTPVRMIVEAGQSLRKVVHHQHVVTKPSSSWDVSNLQL